MADYNKLGLKVGIEIHCQLNTRHKLFCNCPAELAVGDPDRQFFRRLRPTQSELGEVDPAALFEFQKGRLIEYAADQDNSCLVEADEEPPHNIDPEAVNIALTVARLLKATPVHVIYVMRKVVIDGSSTTGFQRTAAIALNGTVTVQSKPIPIQHISVEEDASRKVKETDHVVNYRIDRLGIPLVEIATGPVIYSPQEAQEVAFAIGRILKATRKVKRGLGTIRQDLNVSIASGALIEIKGVQRLELISKVVEMEVDRQTRLLEVKEELTARGLQQEELKPDFKILNDIFEKTRSKVIEKGLRKGGIVVGVKLPKFGGLLRRELIPGVRLGTELSWHAMFYGGVGGIFHTDELPGYGITEEEKQEILSRFEADEQDGVVLVCDASSKAKEALKAVIGRAKIALKSVPDETRAALEDGTTRYMRPRPGAARMYPETDVNPLTISENRLKTIEENLPEMPETLLQKIMQSYNINQKLSMQLLDSDYLPLFEDLTESTQIAPTFIATVLTETLKSLERKNIPLENLDEKRLRDLFILIDLKKTAKESIETIIEWLCTNTGRTAEDAINTLNLRMLSQEELHREIEQILQKHTKLASEAGDRSTGKLIGLAMSDLRGRADADDVIKILKERLK